MTLSANEDGSPAADRPGISSTELVQFLAFLKLVEQNGRPGKTPMRFDVGIDKGPKEVNDLFEAVKNRIQMASPELSPGPPPA